MKLINKYVADDGSEHKSAEAASARDILHHKVLAVMEPLGETPEDVQRGRGWLQHDPETVLTARDKIIELCRKEGFADRWPVFNNPGREIHPMSVVGRILNDNGGPLDTGWGRFARIDALGREHQQPYFAINGPDKDHVMIEDRR